MSYIQEIQEAKDLLNNPKATYEQLLDKLCELERLHGKSTQLVAMGFNEDIIIVRKIGSIKEKIKIILKHRVKQLAAKDKEKKSALAAIYEKAASAQFKKT